MASSNPNQETLLYPMVKRRKSSNIDDLLSPLSGLYEGKFDVKGVGKADLELKLDIDRIRNFSPVLNIVSGSIVKSSGQFVSLEDASGLYFRSARESVKVKSDLPGAANSEREISCDIVATRSDGEKYPGKFNCILRLPQDNGSWGGYVTIHFGNESVNFEEVQKKSEFFRRVTVDVDYVDQVVWPTMSLSDFDDTPESLKTRKLDPFAVFQDAGVELICKKENSNKVEDPIPHNPWTKTEMYDVMMANFDYVDSATDTLWCMIATKPPDERFMGFSFEHRGYHGFGLFTGHKSFDGLLEPSNENFIHASRRFLHYFVHECGHAFGLAHPFEIGRPNDLTWMNYAWKYDIANGPGEFYHDFRYSFTNSELSVMRHSPSKAFNDVKLHSVQVSDYGKVKSSPTGERLEGDAVDNNGEETQTISLRIKLRPEPYAVGELVEVEVRIKNESETTILVERNLSLESGNLILFVTSPEGFVQRAGTIVKPISGSAYVNALLLHPYGGDEGSDRFSELIVVGEENRCSNFSQEGKYTLQAVYTSGKYHATSNMAECVIKASDDSDSTHQRKVNTAFSLGGINQKGFDLVVDEWRKIASLHVEQKKLKVHKLISIVDDVKKDKVRYIKSGTKKDHKTKEKLVNVQPTRISEKEFLDGTKDVVLYYQKQGEKSDNMQYKEVVLARAKVLLKHDVDQATSEFNQLLADLVHRGLKYAGIKSVSDEWNSFKEPDMRVDGKSAKSLQARVEEILDWYPTKHGKEADLSGIGHGTLLSHFRDDHVLATSKIVLRLFTKLDETNDLNDVLDYADNLQRGYQVNHQVLQWAVEIFIIHCRLAKKSGIEYPLPKQKDGSITKLAAITTTQRTGIPRESWMHYWRMDADLNYHHRHWHSVYVVGREIGRNINWFGRWRQVSPELERQGELFAYMHSQMLARYDAERTSWGLAPVQAWDYNDADTEGFNAGFEFHSDPRNANMGPRPPASWPVNRRREFREFERNYQAAVDSGVLPPISVAGQSRQLRFRMDFNLSGHVLEASSSAWRQSLGSIHNSGHGVFGTNRVPGGGSYMLSTVTAMRDPIFYRWHKRIDNLWHRWNDTQIVEIADDAPPVVVESNDIIMMKSETPLDNFESFGSAFSASDEMQTYLGSAQKKFEFDNKKSHDPFYYHIRFRRTAPGDLNLTFRIFICQATQVNNRKMWIEMDKFVYRLEREQNSAVIIRPDRHSSVIKRIPREMEGNVETNSTNMVNGFCECGWPYNMLLPRGTSVGEEYRLCVFISDNNEDRIGVRSSCGSLSFCGASGQGYPDRRPMGYPFTTDVSVRGMQMNITDAIASLSNAALSSFIIKNNIVENPPTSLVSMWSPWDQLQQDDGTRSRSSEVTAYRPSRLVARMRVLIDDQVMTLSNQTGRLSVRFQGRGEGNGPYRITSTTISQRNRTTLNVIRGSPVGDVTVDGQRQFDVPPQGIVCDEAVIRPGGDDLFVTFTLESPGSYLQGGRNQPTNTWVMFDPSGENATSENWEDLVDADIRISSSIYCVGGIMIPLPR